MEQKLKQAQPNISLTNTEGTKTLLLISIVFFVCEPLTVESINYISNSSWRIRIHTTVSRVVCTLV
jgi:hypothetical protein